MGANAEDGEGGALGVLLVVGEGGEFAGGHVDVDGDDGEGGEDAGGEAFGFEVVDDAAWVHAGRPDPEGEWLSGQAGHIATRMDLVVIENSNAVLRYTLMFTFVFVG